MKTHIQWERGSSTPLGVSHQGKGINFALFSQHASAVKLCLFAPHEKHPFAELNLDPNFNRTGYVWHILLKDLPSHQLEYGYQLSSESKDPRDSFDPKKVLSDPYAKGMTCSMHWGHKDYAGPDYIPRGKIILDSPFDWQKAPQPKLPMEDLIIYEMHVRSFTIHPSSKTKSPGTFSGIIEKIPYLKDLGVNAIELMPIFEFDEGDNTHINPKTGQRLQNVWGYSTINFFAPMNRYSSYSEWTGAMDEFRTLIREMHKNNIEVYLDVVYNHTAEGSKKGPWFSFRGIDNQVYYMVHPDGHYLDFSGTGNTFNANHPVVANLILDSLRYWVGEMHVDGFRFDLASCLTRDENGMPLPNPPVIQMINSDPVLANVNMIAEAWDAGGLYQVGHFPCADARWGEWNGVYRDVVRRFIKGTDGQSGGFAKAMAGSQDLYGQGRKPFHSINFVTAHDGFTLRDLVTYQDKHNEENGEDNRDGGNQNDSWNCGCEGPTHTRKIIQLRERQMRNLHAALMLAIGTPMILMGDEYGHTRRGNNNTYGHDDELNWFLWDELKMHADFVRFHRLMIQFRKKNPILRRKEFLKDSDVQWHGSVPNKPNWGHENRFIAYTLQGGGESLYIAFNAHFKPVHVQLPSPPQGKKWCRVLDTSLAAPNDFHENPRSHPLSYTYDMPDYSAMVAQAL